MPVPYPLADHRLAQRLERAEGDANRRFVEARARAEPPSGASWTEVDGTYVMFDGVESPLTQTFGLGISGPVTSTTFERIERYFSDRGATTFHEVSPLADASTLPQLHARGYEAFEFSSVLFQPLPADPGLAPESSVHVRQTTPTEIDRWAQAAGEGWSEFPELEAFMRAFGRVVASSNGVLTYVGEIGGRIAATAAMVLHGGVALLAGASTIPSARRQGAQAALLTARLRDAAERGCDVAMMVAQPGSASQRNAERNGFRVAYTRLKWRRPAGGGG
jgi:GNAT superfamily N-acetyltransferase